MAVKKAFNKGEVAHIRNNKRGKGFMIQADSPVTIIGHSKCDDKHGAYLYDIEVLNPKTNELVQLEGWITQFDVYTKEEWEKHQEQEQKLKNLMAKAKERGVEI